MRSRHLNNAGLLLLAIVFSTGLIFAFIELPRILDNFLQNRMGFPQFDQGGGEMNALKTEMFIQGLHLRWIGYASLLLIVALIIFGYATRRSGWALAGALGLFIPVFGQFALSMFFLAGLGFLRVGWLPFLEVTSIDLLDLGKVIYVPYWILMWFFALFKWDAHTFLTYLFMALGAFLFTWGVLLWFKSRYNKQQVATSWIYSLSRHPQYLGWIIWSYGFILFTPFLNSMKKSWSVPSSLPWLLMTMTILGICMMEEIKMMKNTGGDYQKYRSSSPFMFPLPRWLKHIIKAPARLVTGSGYPTRPVQVAWITLIYTGIFILLSLFWVDLDKGQPSSDGQEESVAKLGEIMEKLQSEGENRRAIWPLVSKIPDFGPPGMDSLMALALEENPVIREFSIQKLGEHKYQHAESIFIENLSHPVRRVRSASIFAAGNVRSERAVNSLLEMLKDTILVNNLFQIYGALGSIGDARAIPCLAAGLEKPEFYNQISALDALMEIDPKVGLKYAISRLTEGDDKVRRHAVMICILSEDPAVIVPLESLLRDEDFEVRFYARQGLKRFGKE